MNTATTSILIGIVLILGIGALVYSTKDSDIEQIPVTEGTTGTVAAPPSNPTVSDDDADEDGDDDVTLTNGTTGSGAAATTGGTVATRYTAAVVATHSTKASCWSIINGNVYDLTSWVPKHPGGEQAILQICGKDGSAKFNGKHGGAAPQATILAGFKIGVVAQ